jgi:hypothetical protein
VASVVLSRLKSNLVASLFIPSPLGFPLIPSKSQGFKLVQKSFPNPVLTVTSFLTLLLLPWFQSHWPLLLPHKHTRHILSQDLCIAAFLV